MIDQGVDVAFGAGGRTGNGALRGQGPQGQGRVRDRRGRGSVLTVPEAKDVLITSAMKIMDKVSRPPR